MLCLRTPFYYVLFFILQINFSFAYEFKKNESPITLKANSISANKNKNIITVSGNIEVDNGTTSLNADRLSYDNLNKQIYAEGNIFIKNDSFGTILAKKALLKDDLSSGKFEDAKISYHKLKSYLESDKIVKLNEVENIGFKNLLALCKFDHKKPLFSLKSDKLTTNSQKNFIKSKKNILYIKNIPFFYIPYISFPFDYSSRKTGFLLPSYDSSNRLGFGIKIPYYLNISPNKDYTITTKYHPFDNHIIVNNKFRHLLKNNSKYKINLEIANNKPKKNINLNTKQKILDKNLRWNISSEGKFFLTTKNQINILLNHVSDQYYLRDYRNDFTSHTQSEAEFLHIDTNNIFSTKIINFQEIEHGTNSDILILPEINYLLKSKLGNFKEKYSLLVNISSIKNQSDVNYTRFSIVPKVNIPFNLKGNLFNLSTNIQTDIYRLKSLGNNQYDSSKNILNYKPQFKIEWSLPLINKFKKNILIIEPKLNFVSTYSSKKYNQLPNSHTNDIELNQNIIFAENKYFNFNTIQNGNYMNYGIKAFLDSKIGEISFELGQSYRFNDKIDGASIIGFKKAKSNFVGEIDYKSNFLNIIYNFHLNQSSYKNDINNLSISFNLGKISLNTNYLLIKKNDLTTEKREQISFNANFTLTKKITAGITLINNLSNKRNLLKEYFISYNGCCIGYNITISENNFADYIKPNRSYNINFFIKRW